MKREDLKKLGLTDEVIEKAGLEADLPDKIMALHGKDIEKHKDDLATASATADELQKQLNEANKTIDGFKDLKPEELQKAAEDWETKYKELETQNAKETKQRQFDSALEKGLALFKVKDALEIKPHLKLDKLVIGEDGSIVGLKEQLEPLKETKDYLFDSDEPEPKVVTGVKTIPGNEPSLASAIESKLGIKK